MMRLLRPTVIALALLTSTATVSAERAWVLWTRLEIVTGPGSTDWGIIQAPPNRADCLAALETRTETSKSRRQSGPFVMGHSCRGRGTRRLRALGNASPTPWTRAG